MKKMKRKKKKKRECLEGYDTTTEQRRMTRNSNSEKDGIERG